MSFYTLTPKGKAMALHLSPEYQEGIEARKQGITKNPYDFWNEYLKYYAWDIGNQKI